MKHYHKTRLKKLAAHLMNGKLGHKKFDFCNWNRGKYEFDSCAYKCGYAGCAIGECPILFKRDWTFNKGGNPCLKNGFEPIYSGRKFFGINSEEFAHLFIPYCQRTRDYGGRELGENAKASSVAKNILALLEKQG